MAQVTVRVDDFEDGAFPMLCASSGLPVEVRRRATASYQPGWPAVFLVLGPAGFVIMFVAMVALTRSVEGWVPLDQELARRGDRERRRAAALAVVLGGATIGATALILSANAWPPALVTFIAGATAVGIAIYQMANPLGAVRARLAPNGRGITMSRVHPDFVDAYNAQEWARRAERRDDSSRT
jgi:hypothetical protein